MRPLYLTVSASLLLFACGDDSPGGSGGGGGNASGGGGEGGAPTACVTLADCPQPAGQCLDASCDDGVCATIAVAMGTPASTQAIGDCGRIECDGAGAQQTVPDDTDTPNDNNSCTADGCESGTPTSEQLSVGTPCDETGMCDASGACVECLGNLDCGTATECAAPTCAEGACITVFTPDGTAIALQQTGDCKEDVCDGAGAEESVNLDTDSFDDGNSCTADGCVDGSATHVAQPGQSCGVNGQCNAAGQCEGCTVPADCPGQDDFCRTRTCSGTGVCGFNNTADDTELPAASQTGGDCATLYCQAGVAQPSVTATDIPVDGQECTLDVCNGAAPGNPPVSPGTSCAMGGGAVCDGNGSCIGCLVPADCGTPGGFPCVTATCSLGSCGTADAASGTGCGAASCMSGTAQAVDTCNGFGACINGASTPCSPYACGPSACVGSCVSDAGCAAGFSCDTGIGVCTNGPKCTDYCNSIQSACTGSLAQYFNTQACLDSCKTLPSGTAADTAGNTIGCRTYHAGAAGSQPNPHCYHAGPGGAGVCGADCDGFCTIAQASCTGANQSFSSFAACTGECAGFPAAPAYTATVTSGDSFACRMYHLTSATQQPATHCSHIIEASATCN